MNGVKKLACGFAFSAAVALGVASAWAYDYNDIPGTYEPVKMLISSGAQYINTGYTPGTSTSIQMEFDAGSTWAEYTACGGTATEDMRGYERLSGSRLDIGCYASRPRGSVYYLR